MDDLKARLRGMDGDSMSIKTLDEAADRIEQLERERDEALNQLDSERYTVTIRENRIATLYSRIKALELALIRSRAETAAAFERAADVAKSWKDCGHDFDVEDEIRALATPDQTAALVAVLAEARAQGMREAAEIANSMLLRSTFGTDTETVVTYRDFIGSAILAAIKGAKA
jgi:hypothetical protein